MSEPFFFTSLSRLLSCKIRYEKTPNSGCDMVLYRLVPSTFSRLFYSCLNLAFPFLYTIPKDGKNITTSNRSFWKAATPEALWHHINLILLECSFLTKYFLLGTTYTKNLKCSCLIQYIITGNNTDISTRSDEMKLQICDVRLLFN